MAQIQVKDTSGNPIPLDKGRVNIRVSKSSDDAAVDDRFTDNAGNTAWPGGYVGGEIWSTANLYVNTRNVNSNYKSATITNADLTKDVVITLEASGVVADCPNPNDKKAVSDWFYKVAASVGARTNTEANRNLMIPGFSKCQVAWQNQNRPPMRARFFLNASGPNLDSGYVVNTGDENGPFNLSFMY